MKSDAVMEYLLRDPPTTGSSVTEEVTARASRASGPPAAIFAATLTRDQCDGRRGGTAIS